MNWIQFLQTIAAVYIFYYAVVITFELAGRRKLDQNTPGALELIFHQEDPPKQISKDDQAMPRDDKADSRQILKTSPGVPPSAGGVSMTSLVDLAKADVNAYTRDIPY